MSAPKRDNQEILLAAASTLLIMSPMLDPVITCCIAAGLLTITLAGRLFRRGRWDEAVR